MAETLLVHDSLRSVTQVDPFGRPPVSICLTRVSSLQEEQIPGETLMICHRMRNPRGSRLHSHSDDLPFSPWLPLASYILLRVGRGFVMVTDDAAYPRGNTALSFDLAFYRAFSAFRTPETCRSRLDCDRCAFYRAGRTTDDFLRENRHDLCNVFSTRVPCFCPPSLYESFGKDDTR